MHSDATDCTISDSSTLCAESLSLERFNQKYLVKVKELLLEQQQHLNDLNILRRIFMYLLQKFSRCLADHHQLVENVFGNINEVYEVALRLADSVEDAVLPVSTGSSQCVLIGQQFWELAEGDEFAVYQKYALQVTNYKLVMSSLKTLLSAPNVYQSLKQTSTGLADICSYLLPKMLLGSVYHIMYLYETVEYLVNVATDEEDKALLGDTLDTLKPVRFKLRDLRFVSSKQRLIEMSFRLFQPHQFQPHANNNNLVAVQHRDDARSNAASYMRSVTSRVVASAANVGSLTERKWKEMEMNVESFKLPSSNLELY